MGTVLLALLKIMKAQLAMRGMHSLALRSAWPAYNDQDGCGNEGIHLRHCSNSADAGDRASASASGTASIVLIGASAQPEKVRPRWMRTAWRAWLHARYDCAHLGTRFRRAPRLIACLRRLASGIHVIQDFEKTIPFPRQCDRSFARQETTAGELYRNWLIAVH